MSQLVKVNMRLKNDDLQRSLRLLAAKSDRLPSYLANKACHWIAKRAEANMPVVPVARITAEMTAVTPRSSRHHRALTTAERIVIARMHPNSAFNIRTGHVFQLQPPPGVGGSPTRNRRYKLGGQSQSKFFDWVEAHATRMIGARRSSSGFFKVCASVVKWMFHPRQTPNRPPSDLPESLDAQPGSGNVSKNIGRLAGGRLARGSDLSAEASFWVTATEPDTKGVPGNAIFRVAQPIWQRAVDTEAASIRGHAEKLYGAAIKSSGLVVK